MSPLVKYLWSHECILSFWMSNQWLSQAVFTWSWHWSSKTLGKLCLNQWGTVTLCYVLFWFVWLCVTKYRPFISDRSDTRRHQRTFSILLTFRGTMQRLQPFTSTGEMIKTLMRVIIANRQMKLQSIITGRNELPCEGSDMSKHRRNPWGTRHLKHWDIVCHCLGLLKQWVSAW